MTKRSCSYALTAIALMLGTSVASGDQLIRRVPALSFTAALSGAQESPEVATDAVGVASARFDAGLTNVFVQIRLIGDIQVVAGHFHCARPGANGPVAFGLMTPGLLTEIVDGSRVTLTNTDFTGADCVPTTGRAINNIAALALAMRDGLVYVNLHSPTSPGGQIRGQMIEDQSRTFLPR